MAVVTLARLVASDAVGSGVSTELAELFGVTSRSVVRSIVGNGRGIGVALGAKGLVVAISASLRLPLHRFSVVHRKTLRVGHGQTVTAVATVPPMTRRAPSVAFRTSFAMHLPKLCSVVSRQDVRTLMATVAKG